MSLVVKKITSSTVDVPVQVPGELKSGSLPATWKLHEWEEYRKIAEALKKGEMDDEELVNKELVDIDVVLQEEWREDEGGAPEGLKVVKREKIEGEEGYIVVTERSLGFAEAKELVMSTTYIRRPLIMSWFAAQEGRNQAAAKN
ncbi:hypothetical protein K7H09_19285 [Halomonas sp. IOP_14]|uniref:hypothetical protein n=1 Tax=Halomonas sp. IOP_14 TaxID=2873295 RepID=UPI001E4DAB72|nr:hypothetical protein [Halomonas sp. IOP_14]MCD1588149.1 hypothetical protein [Halomonas sp. IOP_14]|tara:strand:- start:776 stop:1207 length:432 start_codon:yes stop_codon:yes gene_type:complete